MGGGGLPLAYTRLADGDRTDTGHHLALRQVTVADDALVAVLGLQIGMLAEKVGDLGLDRLGEKGTCPAAHPFCELIVEDSWLNQMDDVIVGHGISLLRWRSGGVKHPHDMPPSRFPPSPTLGDSSRRRASKFCPADGSSNVLSHGSVAVADWQRISKRQSPAPLPGHSSPTSEPSPGDSQELEIRCNHYES